MHAHSEFASSGWFTIKFLVFCKKMEPLEKAREKTTKMAQS